MSIGKLLCGAGAVLIVLATIWIVNERHLAASSGLALETLPFMVYVLAVSGLMCITVGVVSWLNGFKTINASAELSRVNYDALSYAEDFAPFNHRGTLLKKQL